MSTKIEMEQRIKTLETQNIDLTKTNEMFLKQQTQLKQHAEKSGSMLALYTHAITRLKEEISKINEGERIARTK